MSKKQNIDHQSVTGPDGKHCSKCKRFKKYSLFNKDKGTKDGYARQCKTCRRLTQKKSRLSYLHKIDALKANEKCAKCGETRVYMLDYHHNKPETKTASISALRDQWVPIKKIKEEMAKCTVLCTNHHRELHFKKLTIKEYLKE